MKIALEVAPTPQTAQFASQVGVRHAVIGGPDSPTGRVEYADLARIQELFATYDLEVCAVENVPSHFYDQVMFGLPGRDRQLDNYCATIEAIGRAGIPILGYNWMLLGGISTDQVRGRGASAALRSAGSTAPSGRRPGLAQPQRQRGDPGAGYRAEQ